MRTIRYIRTNMAKQIFLITCFIFLLLRFTVMCQIVVYKIEGYYENTNIMLTLLMYFILFCLVGFFFRGYKYFLVSYDQEKIIYSNKLRKKDRIIEMGKISRVILDVRGISFYNRDNRQGNSPALYIPLFRLGKMDALELNEFYKFLKDRKDISIEKRFGVLPGYGKYSKILSVVYIILSIMVFFTYATPIKVIVVLFQNH